MGGAPLVSGEVSELATAFHQPLKLAGVKKYLTKRKKPSCGDFPCNSGRSSSQLIQVGMEYLRCNMTNRAIVKFLFDRYIIYLICTVLISESETIDCRKCPVGLAG
jgi:hypothetical protein